MRDRYCKYLGLTPEALGWAICVGIVAFSGWVRASDAKEEVKEKRHRTLAIENIALVDVVKGRIVSPRSILIIDERIAKIGDPGAVTVPADAVHVDGRDHFLIPGLVDMHVHLFNNATHRPPNEWMFPLFVVNGVLGVREMAAIPADMSIVEGWRMAVEKGELIAPRVVAVGIPVNGESEEIVRKQVRDAHGAGADFIKVFSGIEKPQWRAAIDEARRSRIPLCGHIPGGIDVLSAARAGQRSGEHLTQVYEACSSREKELLASRQSLKGEEFLKLLNSQEQDALESYDQKVCNSVAAGLAKTHQVQVPTLTLAHFEAREARTQFQNDPRWRYLRPDEQERWKRILEEELDKKLVTERLEVSLKIATTLHRAGVRILAGSDSPMPLVYPGWALHKELELLVEAGLTPAEALRAATIGPAEFLGLSKNSGAIEVGKQADLVLLDADPLSDIRNTQRIRGVILNGRWLSRTDMDALLDSAASIGSRH